VSHAWLRRAGVLALSGIALARAAAADLAFERSFERLLADGRPPTEFDLGLRAPEPVEIRAEDIAAAAQADPAELRKPKMLWIDAVSALTIIGSAANSFLDSDGQKWHFHNEGFFGRNTYAGGGDKASHFVSYYTVARLLTPVYEFLDAPPATAYLLAAGVSAAAGFITEVGDGRTHYGFAYEDLVLDSLGAATSLALSHYRLNDLIGFRSGLVPAPPTPAGNPNGGYGNDYSEQIYTGDLKISGLAPRLHFNPGPARFLYLSATYGVKGYPYGAPDTRERQIGIEIGLHLTEIMRAAGVPEDRWWSKPIYVLLDLIRLPYTSIGYYYDLNHHKWRGPSIGDSYPGGQTTRN
jgi:hypothetical protein